MTAINFKSMNGLCDWWLEQLKWTVFGQHYSINEELGCLIKDLEKLYGLKDDFLPWEDIDRDMAFQEVIESFLDSCMGDECVNILAIFCLDRGLFYCQMGGLKKQAYEEYLLSAVVSSKRLSE